MKKINKCLMVLLLSLVMVAKAQAVSPVVAVETVADYLAVNQNVNGSWPGAANFTGSIVPGMIRAWKITGNAEYLDAAIAGGDYIINTAGGNYFGDEAYSLMLLSELSLNPANNSWRTALINYFNAVKNSSYGTAGYLEYFDFEDPSESVIYLSYYAVAANYVNATDKTIFRTALRKHLVRVEDGKTSYPTAALSIAYWALQQTGPMGTSLVHTSAASGSYWFGIKLNQLAVLASSHQVATGVNAGSFYWRLDHTNGGETAQPVAGYTEDTIFGAMALMAMHKLSPSNTTELKLKAAQKALTAGIATNGIVREHIYNGGLSSYVYAGEILAVLPIAADTNRNDMVGMDDLTRLLNYWLDSNCANSYDCAGADINLDGKVNLLDFALMSNAWLTDAN